MVQIVREDNRSYDLCAYESNVDLKVTCLSTKKIDIDEVKQKLRDIKIIIEDNRKQLNIIDIIDVDINAEGYLKEGGVAYGLFFTALVYYANV